jgi:hypothetical protein
MCWSSEQKFKSIIVSIFFPNSNKDKGSYCDSSNFVSLNYSKSFHIFSFALEETITSVLLQKNDHNTEQPIAFMSKALRDVELKYAIMLETSLCSSSIFEAF